jgi:hypothetical protein
MTLTTKEFKFHFHSATNARISVIALFICLITWSIGSSIGSGMDTEYHTTSIWCAWGEKPGLCENREMSDEGIVYADVPYLYQMCDGRPIDSHPRCDKVESNESMQRLRTADNNQMNVFYKVMHFFSSENPTRSIIWMRLFNSTITSLVFLGILTLTTSRTKIAGLSAWTFTVVPLAYLKFTSINPRGWSLLGAMTSWIFLHELLKATNNKGRRRALLWFAFFGSAFLAFATRIDSSMFVVFTTCLVILQHLTHKIAFNRKKIATIAIAIMGLGFVLRSVDRLSSYLNFQTPKGFPISGYFYYVSTRIPEAIAEIWGYEVGQSGNGPSFSGIIGLSLFVLALYTSLRFSTSNQLIFVGIAAMFLVTVNYWGLLSLGLQAPGHYTSALVSFLLGVTILYSSNREFFMNSKTTRNIAIGLLGYSHAAALYSYMDLYVTGGENEGVIKSLPLQGWWWNSWSSPNWVLLIGALAFPVSLFFAWGSAINSELK